jgi:hydroxymethylglutaryl-CoA synthase
MAGIVGYGAYIPRNRIKVEEIAKVWGADAPSYKKGLMLEEKSVPSPDQDTITMAVEASKNALKRAGIDPKAIGAVYVGSESHPYAVKPSGTVLAEAINATPEVHTGAIKYGLAVGADTSQGAPGDALEYSAAAGAAAFIFGKDKVVAEALQTYSFTTDTPDFWRREYQYYPQHGGRFTGDPAYFKHITGAAEGILAKAGMKPADFDYVIFHQPNGKFPFRVGEMLGFTKKQIEPGWLVSKLGNTYSASSPLGLTATLDISKPGDMILIVSYGSGAGSDAFIFRVTERIEEVKPLAPRTRDLLDKNKVYIDYGVYAKYRRKIRKAE